MNTTKTLQATNPENIETIDALDFLGSYFSDLSKNSEFGKEMLKKNIPTEFSSMVDEMLKNPLDTAFTGYRYTANSVAMLLKEVTNAFLKENKSLINKIILPFENNNLVYNIILKEDTTSNRAILLRYIFEYNNTAISNNFKIVFTFIPKQFKNAIEGKELKLA